MTKSQSGFEIFRNCLIDKEIYKGHPANRVLECPL